MPASPGLRPSFVSSVAAGVARSVSSFSARYGTAIRAADAALPQGPSLRSGLCCPGPSTLNRPHAPHSQARRHFTAQRLIGDAFAVPFGLGDPRLVPCFRWSFFPDVSSSETPESPLVACALSTLRQRHWPSPSLNGLGTLDTPTRPCSVGSLFRGFLVRSFATTRRFASPPDGPDQATGAQPSGTFTSELSAIRSPSSPSDMATVSHGQSPPAGLSPARTSTSIAAPRLQAPGFS
jgi:hypothetical protein